MIRLLRVLSVISSFSASGGTFQNNILDKLTLKDGGVLAASIIEELPQASCSPMIISDSRDLSKDVVFQEIRNQQISWGMSVFEVRFNSHTANSTKMDLSEVIYYARQLRRLSWCLVIVIASEDINFISAFAKQSLQGRLMVWSTKLLLVTSLPLRSLQELLFSQWTFSMMNSMVLKFEQNDRRSWSIYSSLPYSPIGQQLSRLASWTPKKGIIFYGKAQLFPDKFSNFHGATVNITALTYAPYWTTITEKAADGTTYETYKGTDASLMSAIAKALNFKVYNIPTESWDEVAERVTERRSFMASVFHFVLPQRMNRYDYSYTYEFASMAFATSKPELTPKWQSLYYPLSGQVWLLTLVAACIVPLFLLLLNYIRYLLNNQTKVDNWFIAEAIVGSLLSQPIAKRIPNSDPIRVLVTVWLLFAFILGSVYRGNLTSYLTLPKYPPRAETIQELIKFVDKVISPPYGAEFQAFFRQSDSEVFQTLAQRMDVGPSVLEGLQRSSKKKEAYLDGQRYIELNIAEHFTRADGSTNLYVGRQSILPGLAAWPIPFDAPFRPHLDSLMMDVLKGGLYEKWSRDTLDEVRLESRRKQRLNQEKEGDKQIETDEDETNVGNNLRALSIIHMQGPFMLLALGIGLASITLLLEYLWSTYGLCCVN